MNRKAVFTPSESERESEHFLRCLSLITALNEVCEGYVFTGVCDFVNKGGGGGVPGPGGVCSQGGVVCSRGRVCSLGMSGLGGLVLGGCLVETPRDGHCCGRYVSYWNAFLFFDLFCFFLDLCRFHVRFRLV